MKDNSWGLDRRRFIQGTTAVAGSVLCAGGSLLATFPALAQDPPTCPAPPSGGTNFVAGTDKRPITLRKSVGALSSAELSKLHDAYAALRALPASDKRTWLMQADMHALFCASCTNSPTDIHGSWNFFPWHRAYLYYFERILGSLVGDLDGFRLPYWDWEHIRTLPSSYASPGNSGNSLWDGIRNSGLAGGGNLPATHGTSSRITTLYGLSDFATFGGDAGSAGSLESDPHGIIHTDVGQPASPRHDMGSLGYAARDPLFFAHHCNIDKIWSGWNDLSSGGTSTDYKNPTNSGFLNARWSFWDENQQVVSISAADVLNHQDSLRYVYKGVPLRIPRLGLILECRLICCRPGPDPGPFLEVSEQVRETVMRSFRQQSPVILALYGISVPPMLSGAFEVVAVRGEKRTVVGSLGLLEHEEKAEHRKVHAVTLALDVTKAVEDLLAKEKPATLHVVSVSGEREQAGSSAGGKRTVGKDAFELKAERAEIRVEKR
jgi:polyphenol oxidase